MVERRGYGGTSLWVVSDLLLHSVLESSAALGTRAPVGHDFSPDVSSHGHHGLPDPSQRLLDSRVIQQSVMYVREVGPENR
ncbi:MAG: hypothetical protein ACK53Y_04245 [bacterium]